MNIVVSCSLGQVFEVHSSISPSSIFHVQLRPKFKNTSMYLRVILLFIPDIFVFYANLVSSSFSLHQTIYQGVMKIVLFSQSNYSFEKRVQSLL